MPLTLQARSALGGVVVLICFLGYGSQICFHLIEPSPLGPWEALVFNASLLCIWICYFRACFTPPGYVPSDWKREEIQQGDLSSNEDQIKIQPRRWCRRCEGWKPPRAHHCKSCQRCVLKMDHHCPWTINCVSHRTFPHFLRFLFYTVASTTHLEYLLYLRAAVLWHGRNLPSYLGPSAIEMALLFVLVMTNSITWFALSVLLLRSIWSLATNVTTIETWEIERHETLLRRARASGGYLDGPDGVKVRITRQEFPYDIGIIRNICQGMGSRPSSWLWPLATTLSNESGLQFETNGFEDSSLSWPPPDPDRIPRQLRRPELDERFAHQHSTAWTPEEIESFGQRQRKDLMRQVIRRKPFHERDRMGENESRSRSRSRSCSRSRSRSQYSTSSGPFDVGEEVWRDSAGDRLDDFGVDENIEFYDEDQMPLAEFMERQISMRRL